MALRVGSAVATVGARFDDDAFDRWDRRVDKARASARRPIEQELGADLNEKGFKRYQDRLDDTERHTGKFRASVGASFGALRFGIAGAAAAGAGAVGALAASVTGAASDINESLSKNRVLFGDYAKEIERFSSTSAKQFGISKQAALEYTGTFGNLTRALGVSQKDSARISVDLTKQAADMASFNNTTIEDALDALRSGLVGETEPLRRFGVTLSANAVAAEAMRSGIVKVKKDTLEYRAASITVEKAQTAQNKAIKEHGKNSLEARDATVTLEKANRELTKTAAGGKVELTGQQKMQASLSLITRQTAAAQGDFARTSGQSANQSRILHARLDDLQANVGAKVLPVFSRLVKGVNGFVDGMENGTGAGGKFADVMQGVARAAQGTWTQIKETVRWFKEHETTTTALAAATAALAAGFGAYRIVGTITTLVKNLRTAQLGLNLAFTANPIGLTIAAVAALAAGLVVLYKRSETARRIIDGAFRAIKSAASTVADAYLGMISTVLGGFEKLADVASHIPGIGSKFKGLAGRLHDVRDSIDGWRESLRKGDDASRDSGKEADRQRAKVNKLRDAYDDAREKQRKLKKGTDEYRDAARDATRKAEALTRAIADSGTKATNARRPINTLRGNIEGLGSASSTTAEAVIEDLNAALKGMGAKPISIKVSRRGASGVFGTPDIGGLPQKAIGGIANPAGGARDDHMLIDATGRPVAMMAGTEGILNRPQMGLADTAFAIAHAVTGGALPGSLSELWGLGLRHYAGGGRLQLPESFSSTHQTAGLAGYPAVDVFAPPGTVVLAPASGRVSKFSGQARGPGGGGAYGYSMYIDAANGGSYYLTHMGSRSVRVGQTVRRGQPIGTVVDYPGGVPDHIHEGKSGGPTSGAGGGYVNAPTLQAPGVSDKGPLGRIISAMGRRMTTAANRYLGNASPGMSGSVDPGGPGHWSKARIAAAWRTVNPRNGDPNLMAAISLAESAGDPNVVNSIGAGGLMQIYPPEPGYLDPTTNLRIAGRKLKSQGLRAWEAYTNGAYRRYLNAGGLLRRFQGGGPLKGLVAPAKGLSGITKGLAGYTPGSKGLLAGPSATAMRPVRDGVDDYARLEHSIETQEQGYSLQERRYNQTDEEFINPDGSLNQRAIDTRVAELDKLRRMRTKITDTWRRLQAIARRAVGTYTMQIRRFRQSLRHAKGKDRTGIQKQITKYEGLLDGPDGWRTKVEALGFTVQGSELDITDLTNEMGKVSGTQPNTPADTTGTGDTGLDPGAGAPAEAAAPDVDQVARAEQAEARAAALEQDLSAVRANVTALTSTGDLGAGGSSAWATVAGAGTGAGWTQAAGGLAGQSVTVEVHSFVPPTGAELERMGRVTAAALGSQPSRPAIRELVG